MDRELSALMDMLIDEEGWPPSVARRIATDLLPLLRRYGQVWNHTVAADLLAREEARQRAKDRPASCMVVWSEP
jgi:hypothetical protein